MPKCSRKQDSLQSMPMVVKPGAETPMYVKKAVVKELIRQEKVVVHKKNKNKNCSLLT